MATILPAHPDDAVEILAIQRRAFAVEAGRSEEWQIPPLTETLESVIEHINSATVLKVTDGRRLVGSIRGVLAGSVCTVRALSVDPDFQGNGLGSVLLDAIERAHPQASSFELFTNSIMEENVRFYVRHGYQVIGGTPHSDKITLVHMGKRRIGDVSLRSSQPQKEFP
jgi:GNAT superfamily N-acetyltransferase